MTDNPAGPRPSSESGDSTFSWDDAEKDRTAPIDTTIPHSARLWNYMLGGKDNYPVDREAADRVREIFPGVVDMARQSRYMLTRVVRHLAGDAGIRQFLDIGTGLPTVDNTHEVAQRVAPQSRIVYVDNDPLVLVHAAALLNSTPEGACDYIQADVRDPETILTRAAKTLDFDRPIALMLMGILGMIVDFDEARSIVSRLTAALPTGSYVAVYDGSDTDPAYVEAATRHIASGGYAYIPRSPRQIARFLDGLEILEPGVVSVSRWRPEPGPRGDDPPEVPCAGGVGRKG